MADSTVVQRPQLVTNTNQGGIITIVSAMLMVFMLLFLLIRIITRIGFNNLFASDDIVAIIGSIIGVVQSITTVVAVKSGLGRQIQLLSASSLKKVEVTTGAADLLFILALAFAKISTAELVARLTRKSEHLTTCRVTTYVIAVWGVASVMTIGTGCRPKDPWNMADRCSTLIPSWTAIGVIDIVSELVLLVLPLYLVWPLQMPTKSKFAVTLAFSCRIVMIPLAVLRIISLNRISHSTDYTFDIVPAIVFAQVEMHFGLIAATIPCLRPFLKAANTGYLTTQAIQVDRTIHEESNNCSYGMQSTTSSKGRISQKNSLGMLSPRASLATLARLQGHDVQILQLPPHLESADEHPTLDPFSRPTLTTVQHGDQRSMTSDGSDRNFIKKTVEYDVKYSIYTRP